MIRFVNRSPQFEKQLESLRKADKKAAKRADTIIEKLMESHGEVSEEEIAVKYGKIKIRNCVKYDLGRGYNLMTIIDGEHLIISFIGKYDMCKRWLENNKNPPMLLTKSLSQEIAGSKSESEDSSKENMNVLEECEETYLTDIDEKYLRLIFSGLANR
ncbi:MAG: hypothetical protein KKC46_08495 [Proteobacteria bacterium]|nr:hypothetical protein [Pseudomonadota bacterium]